MNEHDRLQIDAWLEQGWTRADIAHCKMDRELSALDPGASGAYTRAAADVLGISVVDLAGMEGEILGTLPGALENATLFAGSNGAVVSIGAGALWYALVRRGARGRLVLGPVGKGLCGPWAPAITVFQPLDVLENDDDEPPFSVTQKDRSIVRVIRADDERVLFDATIPVMGAGHPVPFSPSDTRLDPYVALDGRSVVVRLRIHTFRFHQDPPRKVWISTCQWNPNGGYVAPVEGDRHSESEESTHLFLAVADGRVFEFAFGRVLHPFEVFWARANTDCVRVVSVRLASERATFVELWSTSSGGVDLRRVRRVRLPVGAGAWSVVSDFGEGVVLRWRGEDRERIVLALVAAGWGVVETLACGDRIEAAGSSLGSFLALRNGRRVDVWFLGAVPRRVAVRRFRVAPRGMGLRYERAPGPGGRLVLSTASSDGEPERFELLVPADVADSGWRAGRLRLWVRSVARRIAWTLVVVALGAGALTAWADAEARVSVLRLHCSPGPLGEAALNVARRVPLPGPFARASMMRVETGPVVLETDVAGPTGDKGDSKRTPHFVLRRDELVVEMGERGKNGCRIAVLSVVAGRDPVELDGFVPCAHLRPVDGVLRPVQKGAGKSVTRDARSAVHASATACVLEHRRYVRWCEVETRVPSGSGRADRTARGWKPATVGR